MKKYTKVEMGMRYYSINNNDRESNIDNHNFEQVKVRCIRELERGYAVYISNDINYLRYKNTNDINFERYGDLVYITVIIEKLDKMPTVIEDKVNKISYSIDKIFFKSKLKDLVQSELDRVKSEISQKLEREKSLLEVLKGF